MSEEKKIELPVVEDWRKDWKPEYLSPSRINQWKKCPAQYKFDRIDKVKTPGREYFATGNVFDQVVFEEFRLDMGQEIEPIVQVAGDELYHRLKTDETLRHATTQGKKANEPFTDEDIRSSVMNFRTWTRGFLDALSKGEDYKGNKVLFPAVKDTQVLCKWPIEIDGKKVTIAGYADILHEDGSVSDLKMASTWNKIAWSMGRVLADEIQWIAYSQALNTNTFRYIIMEKQMTGKWPNRKASTPTVKVIKVDITPRDIERFKDLVTSFLRETDFLNGHKNGVFPPRPAYEGNLKDVFNRNDPQKALTQVNFCTKLCDFKEQCYKENFSGDVRMDVLE